jgi:hypothetical protein
VTGKYGIQLSRLCVRGQSVPDAELTFEKGLNVVFGISNTGKSYTLKCIDYMFGGQKPPKSIKEAASYETLLLELETATGEYVTLQRSLKGGDLNLFSSPINEITDESFVDSLSQKHGSKGESVSEYLMKLCGFPANVKVKKDESNTLATLSMRGLIHFFCVNEGAIQLENSPIYNDVITDRTKNRSILNYLLTGISDNSLIKKPKKEITTARVQAKEEVFLNLIDAAKSELQSYEEQLKQLPTDLDLDREIELISSAVETFGREIESHIQSKRQIVETLTESRSRIIAIEELVDRFLLLKQHYLSDLKRLEFISEGEALLGQLQPSVCQTCGQTLLEPAHVHNVEDPMPQTSIQESCNLERKKIESQLADLESTFVSLNGESDELKAENKKAEQEIEGLDSELANQLRPKWSRQKDKLQSLMNIRRIQDSLDSTKERLKSLTVALAAVKKAEAEETKVTKEAAEENESPETGLRKTVQAALLELCQIIEGILTEWKFATDPRVTFDEDSEDIVVDGVPRQDNGKGTRALLYSAFSLGLLDYCKRNNRPHPGFLILDSPLTTLKEAKPEPDKAQEIGEEVQQAFFMSLAKRTDIQCVVLENKEPPDDVKALANVVEFTKRVAPGERFGFFPVQPNLSEVVPAV